MTLIFVYGTLKRGFSNHHHLDGQAFLGAARTAPGYALYALAEYPGMVRQEGDPRALAARCGPWTTNASPAWISLECTAEGLYGREAVRMGQPFEGRSVEAYVYLKDTTGLRKIGPDWPH
jgi:gamma-glutamylaminecyclotransferase